MKATYFLLATFIGTSVLAGTSGWTVMGEKHPLWESLDVEAVKVQHKNLDTESKTVGSITCTKTIIPSGIVGSKDQLKTVCEFPSEISNKEAQNLYSNLKVRTINTIGAYTEIKVVDKMIVVGSDDIEEGESFAKVYLENPCQKVYSESEAKACFDFWGTSILPSFESQNDAELVVANEVNKDLALRTMNTLDGVQESLTNESSVNRSDYIGILIKHIYAGRHLNYFSVKKGKNVIPQEIYEFDLESAEVYFESADPQIESYQELQSYKKKLLETLYLGLSKELFEEFDEELSEYFEWVEENYGVERFNDKQITCQVIDHPIYSETIVHGDSEIHFIRKDGVETSEHHDGYNFEEESGKLKAIYHDGGDVLFTLELRKIHRQGIQGSVYIFGYDEGDKYDIAGGDYKIQGCVIE